MEIRERIKEVRTYLKLNQKDFGDKINVSQNHISSIEKGSKQVTERMMKLICFEYNVNYFWLKNGEGEMFSSIDTSLMAAVDRMMSTENEGAKRLFKAYAQLEESEWDALNSLIDRLADLKK